MTSLEALPREDSPDLYLTHPTPAESVQVWTLVHSSWGDSLKLPQFLAESAHLLTVPLAKDGGMTLWILVDKNLPPDERPILASCETFKKRGLVADGKGGVEDVVLHAVASVFCDPVYRGRGYGKRMMQELGEALKGWQVEEGEKCMGSLLYSDIGKEYYAKLGWKPAGINSHLEFAACKFEKREEVERKHVVLDADLDGLCERDEEMIRRRLGRERDGRSRVVVFPTSDQMRWHHAKEDFMCERILDKEAPFKGVLVGGWESADRMWAVWTRRFYGDPKSARRENTLYILRLAFETEEPDEEQKVKMRKDLKLVIRNAQNEAAYWGLGTMKIWDPSPLVMELVSPSMTSPFFMIRPGLAFARSAI